MMLLEAMIQYPASSLNLHYSGAENPDAYGEPGVARVRSKGAIRIYNKIGRAYGFTIDNAYVMDIETRAIQKEILSPFEFLAATSLPPEVNCLFGKTRATREEIVNAPR